MKTRLYFNASIFLCFLYSISAYSQTGKDTSYFPLAVGNQWIYQSTNTAITDTETVVDTQRVNGKLYYGIAISYGPLPRFWLRTENNKIYLAETLTIPPDTTDIKEFMIFNFSANINESWNVDNLHGILTCNYGGKVTLYSKDSTVITPVGKFENCFFFLRNTFCDDAGRPAEWFSAGIGKVSYCEDYFWGAQKFVLISSNLITNVPNNNFSKSDYSFNLFQNYPNPFNPTTEIKYSIKDAGFVLLKIYNLLGQEVKTLVNYYQSPGEYTIKFDASGLASGIYFYSLKEGSYNKVRKMLLSK